jgi:RNA polymerase sigma-70 factor, ECF subfamily
VILPVFAQQRDRLWLRFLQVAPGTTVLPRKYLNKSRLEAVFMIEGMIEGERTMTGEAILSAETVEHSLDRKSDRSQERTQDEVIEGLVRRHSGLVYRIAYAALRSHHEAEDATQETFLRVLRYSHRLAAVEDHKTWLVRIAWRVAVDRSQQRGRKREMPLDDPERPVEDIAASDATADDTVHGSQVGVLLERLIAALPEKLRQPLVLSTVDEMSPLEVAATLGIKEAAVRSRLFRARQILQEKLAGLMARRQVRK